MRINPTDLGLITVSSETCMVQVLDELVFASVMMHEKIFVSGNIKPFQWNCYPLKGWKSSNIWE